MFKVLAMFLGICLAMIHITVAVLSMIIYDDYVRGAVFILAALGYAIAGFATVFNNLKVGLLTFIFLFFLDFILMLYYGLLLQFFSCLMALVAGFFVILQIRTEYFAMITQQEEERANLKTQKPIVTGDTPDPLGFDKNFYYNKFYNVKKKKKKGGKKKEK